MLNIPNFVKTYSQGLLESSISSIIQRRANVAICLAMIFFSCPTKTLNIILDQKQYFDIYLPFKIFVSF